MELGISGQLLGDDKPLEDILKLFSKYNVKNIEFWPPNMPVRDSNVPYQDFRYEGRDIEKTKEILSYYNTKITCISVPGAFCEEMIKNINEYVNSLLYTIDLCNEFDVKYLNHYCYYMALGNDADYSNFLKILEPVIKKAEEKDVTLVLENEAHDATGTPDGMLKILKDAKSKTFCTTHDACNYYHASC